MLSEHRDPLVAVLKVLPKELRGGFPYKIPAVCPWRNEDLLSVPGKAVIEFVILIAHQQFIIEADLVKNFFSKHRVAGTFCVTLVGRVSMSRIPDSDRMRHD